jgi:hypothetical protein
MATIAALRTEAKKAGVAPSAIRAAENVKELEALIKRHGGGTKTSTNGRTAVKKSTTVRKSKAVTKATPTKRTGRKPAPAKGRNSGTAKRQAAATPRKAATKAKASGYEAKGGRNVLDGVNYSLTDGWNARPGSAPDTIIKALKRFKGDREKVFDYLVGDIGDFVKPKKRDGSKWAKGEREQMLRYRIARTAWDFALKTDQHEKAENRVQYGTGGTGAGIWKPAKTKKAAPAKARTTKAATKTTRKPAAKATPARKATTRKAATPARKRAVRRSR